MLTPSKEDIIGTPISLLPLMNITFSYNEILPTFMIKPGISDCLRTEIIEHLITLNRDRSVLQETLTLMEPPFYLKGYILLYRGFVVFNTLNNKEISSESAYVYATQKDTANIKKPLETYKFDTLVFSDVEQKDEKLSLNKNDSSNDIFEENKRFLEQLTKNGSSSISSSAINCAVNSNMSNSIAEPIAIDLKVNLKYIGQALNTYLLFDDGVNLIIVDQHAAHERILYDKLINAFNSKKMELQPLLLPYTINVNSIEFNFLSENLAVLNDMGIEISEFGKNSFKVSSIPVYLTNLNLDKFFNDVLYDLS
jgi:DNA mismatch repair ATPase MutL